MATLGDTYKYTFKYNSAYSATENSSRSVSGLNAFVNGVEGSGPSGTNAVSALVDTITNFTQGTMNNVYWVSERSVVI